MTETVEGGPFCDRDDCIFVEKDKFTTISPYNQETDRYGNPVLNSKNVTTSTKHCLSCGKTWTQSVENGFVKFWHFK